MKLSGLLKEKREEILRRWFNMAAASYPDQTARFLRSQKNRFANPVGGALESGLAAVLDCVTSWEDTSGLSDALEQIVKIRAVQDFRPSEALHFIVLLKDIVRDEMLKSPEFADEDGFWAVSQRIDQVSFYAFDLYMQARETLYDIKANEVRRMTYRLLQQAGAKSVPGSGEPED